MRNGSDLRRFISRVPFHFKRSRAYCLARSSAYPSETMKSLSHSLKTRNPPPLPRVSFSIWKMLNQQLPQPPSAHRVYPPVGQWSKDMVEYNGKKGSHRFAISHTCIVNSFVRKDCGDGWKAEIMSGHSEHELIEGGGCGGGGGGWELVSWEVPWSG